LGDNVVDTFYLCERDGRKITGLNRRQKLEDTLLYILIDNGKKVTRVGS
jgi:hypothetical protein